MTEESTTAWHTVYYGFVHPWHCDVMGHLNTRHYLAMFDDASYQLLFEAFGYAGGLPEWDGLGWADVHNAIDYKAELNAGELILVQARLGRVGNKSVSVEYQMINRGSGEVAATMSATIAHFDLKARKAIPLSDQMKERASRFDSQSGVSKSRQER